MSMKAIQITVDEELLKAVDATEEARTKGRSALFRKAAAQYLRQRRNKQIAAAYARGYADGIGLGKEWEGWEDEGEWPQE